MSASVGAGASKNPLKRKSERTPGEVTAFRGRRIGGSMFISGCVAHTAPLEKDMFRVFCRPLAGAAGSALLACCLLFAAPAPAEENKPSSDEENWITMPEGNRATFVGIHGGTVPITIFSSEDGKMIALPGNSGKDFLNILRGVASSDISGSESGAFVLQGAQTDKPSRMNAFDWSRKADGVTGQWIPLGLKPESPRDRLRAEAKRLRYEAERREAGSRTIMALTPLQKIYPNREKLRIVDLGKIVRI